MSDRDSISASEEKLVPGHPGYFARQDGTLCGNRLSRGRVRRKLVRVHYRHKFTHNDHHELAHILDRFKQTRVVVRFGDHELIRQLYPESRWTWNMLTSRTQANEGKSEALIILNGEA
jgi:hypothetical protein